MKFDNPTFVYVPNRIASAKYGYSLIQERIFNAVIFHMQEPIQEQLKGVPIAQMNLFSDNSTDIIELNIPLSHIGKPQQYGRIKDAIKELAGVVVEIPYYNKVKRSHMIRYTGLFKANLYANAKRTSFITIEIEKGVAEMLISIERNKYDSPIHFTRYVYEVVQNARKKYTPRIYKLLCSWKKKGEFYMTINELRQLLGLEDKYKDYCDIKNHVLKQVQEELESMADLWFNCSDKSFYMKDRNGGRLHFVILNHRIIKEGEVRREQIVQMLNNIFSFSGKEIISVHNIIRNVIDFHRVYNKIQEVSEKIDSKEIYETNAKKKYMLKALQNEFNSG
nr:replication initiation protein [uncultured Carboxylicivirga sp.]